MMMLLEFRARIRALYQKYAVYINIAFKFLIALLVFTIINKSIGYDARFTKPMILLLLALLSAFTPSSVLVLLAMAVSIVHIYSVAKLLALLIVLILIVLYCLFLRFTPKYGYVILAVPVLFTWNLSYAVPILLGLIGNPLTILPTTCGVIIYYVFKIIRLEAVAPTKVTLDDTLLLYQRVLNQLVGNKQMFSYIAIFAAIIVVVFIIRRLKVDYASEIAVGAGALVSILGFLILDLRLDILSSIGMMILGTLISAVLVILIQLFRRILDYTAVENVQFEDDDYYYYVKAVPKINVSIPQVKVKRINAQKSVPMEETSDVRMSRRRSEEYEDEE